jgi:hypothetical protein
LQGVFTNKRDDLKIPSLFKEDPNNLTEILEPPNPPSGKVEPLPETPHDRSALNKTDRESLMQAIPVSEASGCNIDEKYTGEVK